MRSPTSLSCLNLLIPAAEVGGVFRIAAAVVLRVLRIRTQRTAAAWKGAARRRYGFGRRVLLDPIDGCRQKVERIQSCTAAAAMSHSRRKKEAVPVPHLRVAAIGFAHTLVVVDGVLRREPWIADAVI